MVMVKVKLKEKVIWIVKYVYCGLMVCVVQCCIDQGKLMLYFLVGVNMFVGYNYMGWYWMDDLFVGWKIVIVLGCLKGMYWVYGYGWVKCGSQGGKFLKLGLKVVVVFQMCMSNGMGFFFFWCV